MRKVTIVVPVLITSCQLSLYPNSGPVSSQASTTSSASAKADGRPTSREVALAKRVKCDRRVVTSS
jgi:hypothetical protein